MRKRYICNEYSFEFEFIGYNKINVTFTIK